MWSIMPFLDDRARQVAELSHQIIASVQTLSNAKNEQEHQAAGRRFSRN